MPFLPSFFSLDSNPLFWVRVERDEIRFSLLFFRLIVPLWGGGGWDRRPFPSLCIHATDTHGIQLQSTAHLFQRGFTPLQTMPQRRRRGVVVVEGHLTLPLPFFFFLPRIPFALQGRGTTTTPVTVVLEVWARPSSRRKKKKRRGKPIGLSTSFFTPVLL